MMSEWREEGWRELEVMDATTVSHDAAGEEWRRGGKRRARSRIFTGD